MKISSIQPQQFISYKSLNEKIALKNQQSFQELPSVYSSDIDSATIETRGLATALKASILLNGSESISNYNQYTASFNGFFKKRTNAYQQVTHPSTTATEQSEQNTVPNVKTYFERILPVKSEEYYNRINQPIVNKINALEQEYRTLTDEELAHKTIEFKEELSKRKTSKNAEEDMHLEHEALNKILPEAYATVREISRRVLNKSHHSEQLLGGISLHNGQIAEMRTGEGKTLAATLPVYLNALTGKGVHVVTVNDYLAQRDCKEMSKVYNALGLSVGCISSNKEDFICEGQKDISGRTRSAIRVVTNRKEAYQCDITYGTNSEFGFDYLRDNMARSAEEQVQRPYNFAIIDEVDSVLIDEARTPLIISGASDFPANLYTRMVEIANTLEKDVDYEVDNKRKNIILTEDGMDRAQKLLSVSDIYNPNPEYAHRLIQAIKAKELFHKDTHYVIKDGEIMIVSEATGRPLKGRQWGEGLHQAIEAKEGIPVHSENRTLASITYQNLFRLYPKIAGMTGTALTDREEFRKIYGLEVNKIPTNSPDIRIDDQDVIFKTKQEKLNAIVKEVERIHQTGRPILIGTTSIEKSEQLSKLLTDNGIEHNVLNAKQSEREAAIIAQAGRFGAVTIATNMAGRGTDILLGGNPEFLAKEDLANMGITPENTPNYEQMKDELTQKKKEDITSRERKQVVELGGLHVIGTEKHESRRIDNQLRGRAARQGDPGSTKFFISLEDDLIRIFGGEDLIRQSEKLSNTANTPIESKSIRTLVDKCQKNIETENFASRKTVLEYDNILNIQRKKFYEERNTILREPNTRKYIVRMIENEVDRLISAHILPDATPDEYDKETLNALIEDLHSEIPQLSISANDIQGIKYEEIQAKIKSLALEAYKQIALKEVESCGKLAKRIEKDLLLLLADRSWVDHISRIEDLRTAIGLRAYAGKDPLEEYKLEAFEMYEDTMKHIQSEMVKHLFKIKYYTQKPERLIRTELPNHTPSRRERSAKIA